MVVQKYKMKNIKDLKFTKNGRAMVSGGVLFELRRKEKVKR